MQYNATTKLALTLTHTAMQQHACPTSMAFSLLQLKYKLLHYE